MSKRGHKRDIARPQPKIHQQFVGQDMTPGRAPAEGPDLDFDVGSPSHERCEQHTDERDPAEDGAI